MSVADVAVHGGRGRRPALAVYGAGRPLLRSITFSTLALYGVLRWATLESPPPSARLTGLFVVAVAVVAVGPWVGRRSRPLAVVGLVGAFLAMLAIAGIPLSWIAHARVKVMSEQVGQGLTALPNSVVPYDGIDPWLRLVIMLGAGVLLLTAAIVIAVAPRGVGDLRRGVAALPLIALAIVPATLVRPQLPFLQGMVLFALVAAFVWGERVAPRRGVGALGVIGAAGIAGMIVGPALEQHHAWVNPQGIAGSLTPVQLDTFDWTQRYGPFTWPRDNRDVLEVKAARPDYWKAENLDSFNGVRWAQGAGRTQPPLPSAALRDHFTQTITVTIRSMSTVDVIGAGESSAPAHLDQPVLHGVSPGTWTVGTPLRVGDSYTVAAYSPHPRPAQLRRDVAPYPTGLAGVLTIALPTNNVRFGGPYEVQLPAFHSRAAALNVIGPAGLSGSALIERSPYRRAYALAQRLATRSPSPYAYAVAIERYLSPRNGFGYDEHPAVSRFPLETFLFSSRRGYCQQFAGAMALLLRMGGVPARVATGFTTGSYDAATHRYVVSDLDAHAWVEAWFPRYGWVRFDPTPGTAPAREGGGLPPALRGRAAKRPPTASRRNIADAGAGAPLPGHQAGGAGIPLAALIAAIGALVIMGLLLARALSHPAPTAAQLVLELEQALARAGRPLHGGVTLQALEQRFGASPEAAGYLRTLRRARFAGARELPNRSQRRALRAQLAAGLGLRGMLRAWWALPPRVLH
jgi:transglutaminase-like putative cysteine protease